MNVLLSLNHYFTFYFFTAGEVRRENEADKRNANECRMFISKFVFCHASSCHSHPWPWQWYDRFRIDYNFTAINWICSHFCSLLFWHVRYVTRHSWKLCPWRCSSSRLNLLPQLLGTPENQNPFSLLCSFLDILPNNPERGVTSAGHMWCCK